MEIIIKIRTNKEEITRANALREFAELIADSKTFALNKEAHHETENTEITITSH